MVLSLAVNVAKLKGKRRSSLGDTMFKNVSVCFTVAYAWSLHCLGTSITLTSLFLPATFFFLPNIRSHVIQEVADSLFIVLKIQVVL